MKRILSREQRAASAGFGMLVVTAVNCFLFHYGYKGLAIANELCTALVYSIWVKRGKPYDEDFDGEETGH